MQVIMLIIIAWKMMFDSLWKSFDLRFNMILESMRKHRDLIDLEANANNIVEAKLWRTTQLEHITRWRLEVSEATKRAEIERAASHVREASVWLKASQTQEDRLDRLSASVSNASNKWILDQDKISSWMNHDAKYTFVWLHGKPGAGELFIP